MSRDEIVRLLEGLGLRGNQVVVHASLSSLGRVDGGASTLCAALLDVVGDGGTILIPAFTYAETLSGHTAGRPVAYHPDLPVSREIGAVAEAFRHLPGVLRSSHPTHSFCAWGRQAREALSTQRDNNPLGPLKKLNVVQGQVLLLGTSLQAATAIHLAEERVGAPSLTRRTALRVNAAGYAERVVLENVPGCHLGFGKLEQHLDPAKVRAVGLAHGAARKIPIRYLVQLATAALEHDPHALSCDRPECDSCVAKRDATGGGPPAEPVVGTQE
jgi:aminoglycoside 3-N-acetyltransferase